MKLISKLKKSSLKKYKNIRAFLLKGKKILVLSDSHGSVFEYIFDNDLFKPHLINVEVAGGATAYGLSKEISTTNSLQKYKNGLKRFKNYDTILIQLGEVDASFILWKKIETGLGIDEAIDLSLKGYKKLIEYLMELEKNIILTGAVLPTLKDDQKADESADLRNTIKATQKERTDLIILYNKRLQILAKEYNLKYIDITKETLNKSTNLIDDKYVRKDMIDHHQSFEETAPLWINKLQNIIKSKL
jgi:hypothetical protein